MEYTKGSCFDLQFILPKTTKQAKDIQKSIIFVNNISDICPIIAIITKCIQLLGYPESSSSWIKPYYFTIPELDKELITKAFITSGDQNLECTILVATDAYGMSIDNPDIIFVIQWDIPLSFDSMIKHLGKARRKDGQSTFILFTLKWTQVQSPD